MLCSLQRATNATFSKIGCWRHKNKTAHPTLRSDLFGAVLIYLSIDYRMNSESKILRSCFLHWLWHQGPYFLNSAPTKIPIFYNVRRQGCYFLQNASTKIFIFRKVRHQDLHFLDSLPAKLFFVCKVRCQEFHFLKGAPTNLFDYWKERCHNFNSSPTKSFIFWQVRRQRFFFPAECDNKDLVLSKVCRQDSYVLESLRTKIFNFIEKCTVWIFTFPLIVQSLFSLIVQTFFVCAAKNRSLYWKSLAH